MNLNRRHDEAPSTRAARNCSEGIACNAARKIIQANGTLRQTCAAIAAFKATNGEAIPRYSISAPVSVLNSRTVSPIIVLNAP